MVEPVSIFPLSGFSTWVSKLRKLVFPDPFLPTIPIRLEEFLLSYGGCLILVSHDRYFLDKLTDHLFIFEGEGKIKDYYGKYSRYSIEQEAKRQSFEKQEKKKTSPTKEIKLAIKTKLSFNEKREYEQLEKEIEKLEAEKTEAETNINSGDLPYEKLAIISERIGVLIELIDEKTFRWMELDEFV